jgi:hypothetical protein
MPANNTGDGIDVQTEAAVVSKLVDMGMDGLARAHLGSALHEIEASSVTAAVESLIEVGVLRQEADKLFPTPPLVRLDMLGMVPV